MSEINVARLCLPGSKSYSNRALILAALSKTPVKICGLSNGDDTLMLIKALRDLGFVLDEKHASPGKGFDVVVHPLTTRISQASIDIGKAGTSARFLPALLLNHPLITETVVRMHPQLQRRPQQPLFDALSALGAHIEPCENGASTRYRYSKLTGRTSISGATSGQFLSGLLMAASAASTPIQIERIDSLVQPDYVRMTLQMLKVFGANVCDTSPDNDPLHTFETKPSEHFGTEMVAIEPDASTACYFMAAAALQGRPLVIERLGKTSLQPDLALCEVLTTFGFLVQKEKDCINVLFQKPKPLEQKSFQFDLSAFSDQAITVGILAVLCRVDIKVTGIKHIRFHESDRIGCLVQNLTRLGVSAQEDGDGFVVEGAKAPHSLAGEWPCHGDHRFAMSGFLLTLAHKGVTLTGAECVNKTAPEFFKTMAELGFLSDSLS